MSELITYTRTRGDDYPFGAMIKINGSAIDISSAVIKFSYKNDTEAVKTIIGVPTTDGKDGLATFTPATGIDFMVSGIYSFDIQRVEGGFTSTHLQGTLILKGDVTP